MMRALLLLLSLLVAAPVAAREDRHPSQAAIGIAGLPKEARDTLALIRRGGPFPHRNDGGVFQNRERRLPQQPSGYYREYTVPTPGARDRGARRLIASSSGEIYYTDDHYRSFKRVRE
jgi:ribonuclease T1